MIEARDLHRWYGSTHAVRGISLDVPPGSVLGVLGPNGAGKSTTIRMLTGVLRPHRGAVTINGIDAGRSPAKARAALGYLPESAAVYSEMSVRGYLSHRASLLGMRGRDRRRAVRSAMERCGIAGVARRRAGALSKGFRQRLALAGAIVHDPPVLVLDEPTNGLDPTQLREARALIAELSHRRTVIVCSHVLGEIERVCERVAIIAAGRVLAQGAIDELRSGHATGCVAEVLSAPQRLTIPGGRVARREPLSGGWERLRIESDGADIAEAAGRAFAQCGAVVRRLEPLGRTLEDVFLGVMAGSDGPGRTL